MDVGSHDAVFAKLPRRRTLAPLDPLRGDVRAHNAQRLVALGLGVGTGKCTRPVGTDRYDAAGSVVRRRPDARSGPAACKGCRSHRIKPVTWLVLKVDMASMRGCPMMVAHATGIVMPLYMTMARPTIDVSPFSCSWRETS